MGAGEGQGALLEQGSQATGLAGEVRLAAASTAVRPRDVVQVVLVECGPPGGGLQATCAIFASPGQPPAPRLQFNGPQGATRGHRGYDIILTCRSRRAAERSSSVSLAATIVAGCAPSRPLPRG